MSDTPQIQRQKKPDDQEQNKENMSLELSSSQGSNNPLEYAYSFWFSKRPGKGSQAAVSSQTGSSHPINYDSNLKLVGQTGNQFSNRLSYWVWINFSEFFF